MGKARNKGAIRRNIEGGVPRPGSQGRAAYDTEKSRLVGKSIKRHLKKQEQGQAKATAKAAKKLQKQAAGPRATYSGPTKSGILSKVKSAAKSRAGKAALGAGATLAAYGAYKLYKRRKKAKANESLESDLQEIMMLAEEHYDYKFESIDEVIEALLDAADDYEDNHLMDDIELYLAEISLLEAEKNKESHIKKATRLAVYGQQTKGGDAAGSDSGIVGAAGIAAGTFLGDKLARKAWKHGSKALKKSGNLQKTLSKTAKSPYAKGAAAAAGALGVAELARRALKRRREKQKGQ